mgnify:CR=1 FL=1
MSLLDGALAWGLIAGIEFGGAVIVTVYCCLAGMRALRERQPEVARALVAEGALMGLNFKLAAALLKTLMVVSWTQVGMLAFVLALRTLLKWTFARERGRLPGG